MPKRNPPEEPGDQAVRANTTADAPAQRAAIVAADKRHVWHPYTPMDIYLRDVDPIVVSRAHGAWLEDIDGTRYLDGNSSWWVSALGHAHPRLVARLKAQAEELSHCTLAGITHEPAARLAEELCAIAPSGLERVFFSDNGSTAIEVAVKMAVQMWRQLGREQKTRFVALDGAFHGDTIGASSLGGVDVFRRPFAGVLFECAHAPFPTEEGYARAFEAIERLVREGADAIAGVFVEPLVQGAAGMRMYSPEYLRALRTLCDEHDVLLIFDEVFTGFGRTGRMWASEHAGVAPDIMCLGKAFASLLPMAATLATARVFDAFRGERSRALYYGHTFCGNPLGAALAREVLAIFRDEGVLAQVERKAPRIDAALRSLAGVPGVRRTRALGMIGAADLAFPEATFMPGGGSANTAPSDAKPSAYLDEIGWLVYEEARSRGAYLRPLGSTVYLCPPLTIAEHELDELLSIFVASIRAVLAREAKAPRAALGPLSD